MSCCIEFTAIEHVLCCATDDDSVLLAFNEWFDATDTGCALDGSVADIIRAIDGDADDAAQLIANAPEPGANDDEMMPALLAPPPSSFTLHFMSSYCGFPSHCDCDYCGPAPHPHPSGIACDGDNTDNDY